MSYCSALYCRTYSNFEFCKVRAPGILPQTAEERYHDWSILTIVMEVNDSKEISKRDINECLYSFVIGV